MDAVCYVILLSAEGYFCVAVCSSGNYLPGCASRLNLANLLGAEEYQRGAVC